MPNGRLTFRQSICLVLSLSVSFISYADEDYKQGNDNKTAATGAVRENQNLQSLFAMGGIALQQRDYPLAAIIFREILKQEYSPRVELELARALFLGGEFSESKEVFNSVLNSGGLPWQVKQKGYLYLQEIDKAVGFVDFSIALISDNNPTNFTSKKEIAILGRKLTVVEPVENRESQGLNYKLLGGFPISSNLLTQAYTSLSVRDFEQSVLDSYTLDTGIRYTPEEYRNILFLMGMENNWDSESHRYSYRYAGIKYSPKITDQFSQVIEYSVGQLGIKKADHLDARQHTAAANIILPIGQNSRFLGGLSLTRSNARETPYSYRSTALSAAVEIPVDSWNFEFGGKFTQANYSDSDPFFGKIRKDKKTVWHINLLNRELDWKGLTPVVGVSLEQTNSSIDYYTYDKVVFTAELRSYR